VLLAASFPKFGHPALAWVSLAPLIVAVTIASRAGASGRRLFALGVATGVVYFTGTIYWIGGVMAAHGGIALPLAYGLMVGLAIHLSLFVGLFSWTLGRVVRRFGPSGVWWAPVLWVAAEWLRAWLGWDFPWVLLGASQATVVPVVQVASVVGTYGLSALVATVGTAAAVLAISRRRADRRGVVAVAALLVAVMAGGAWRESRGALRAAGMPMRVGLLQGDIPQDAKWDPAFRASIMDRYLDLSRQAVGAGAQIVIWPEASTPFYFNLDADAAAPVRRLAAEARVPFIVGTDELERPGDGRPDRYYNAAVLVGSDGRTRATYRKVKLVPFGEYVPFKEILFFVGPLVEAVSDFTAGTALTVFEAEGSRLSVAICYEAVYASIARSFVRDGAQLLATITNDAWFGRSSAAYQHFEQASLRAVEQGRYLVRAANTGISGAVDPYGRVITATGLFEPAAITVDVRLLNARTIYHAIGDVVAWLSLGLTGVLLWLTRQSRMTAP
jgi:apolipoprotein N-acyltransferase